MCFDVGSSRKGQAISAMVCRSATSSGVQQTFSVSDVGELTSSVGCSGGRQAHDSLTLGQCDGAAGAFQKFKYDEQVIRTACLKCM